MNNHWFLLLILSLFLSSCGKELDKTSECDESSSSSFDKSFECPSGTPKNEDIQVIHNISSSNLEAGFLETKVIQIKNNGDAKLFDFKINSNFNIKLNTCPVRFSPGESCIIEVELYEETATTFSNYLSFSERTNKINKTENINYEIKASYPVNKELFYDINETQFNKKRIIVGPLQDRFGNIIEEDFIVNSNRILRNNEFDLVVQPVVNKRSISGSFSFFVETDSLNNNILIDSGLVNVFSNKVYKDGYSINENISVTFFNNKPTISNEEQVFNFIEDSMFSPLSNLIKGEDPQGLSVTHFITKFPTNGVISNCLSGINFINFITCSYTPNPNFFGEDSFEYKSFNGTNESFDSAIVKINVAGVPDAPILKDIYHITAFQNTIKTFILPAPFDPDGQVNFNYIINSSSNNGTLACNNNNCTYTPNTNFVGQDFLTYKTIDADNLESNIAQVIITVENINDKPILGGSETFSTIEDTLVSFVLSPAIDPDGDELFYKIKTPPNKGILIDCLENNSLNCSYLPNKNVDTADSFSYVAVDEYGLESDPRNVTITITQVNDPPEFNSLYQEEQVVPNTQISFVLDNATDPDSNTITYEIVTFPDKGILSNCLGLGGNGLNCQYQSPTGVVNSFTTFSYRAQDDSGAYSEIRTVKIIISNINSNPTLVGTIILNLDEDEEKEFILIRGTDDYTPQENLKYFLEQETQSGELSGCLNIGILSDRNENTVNCMYKPNKDYNGTDSFSYYVEDGKGNRSGSILVQINIAEVNDPPIFTEEVLEFQMEEDSQLLLILEEATDLEEDELFYSIKSHPNNGTLNCQLSILTTCIYIPNQDYYGLDSFSYQAFDGEFYTEKNVKIEITPVNDAPVMVDQEITVEFLEDKITNFTISPATDVDTPQNLISYFLVEPPKKGLLSNCLNINNFKGLNCSYLGKSNEVNEDSFKIRAFDGELYSNTIIVSITITNENDVPYFNIEEIGPFRIEAGDQITFSLEEALDLEGDFLSYEIVDSPTKGEVFNCFDNFSNFECSYASFKGEEGLDYFTYKAFDLENDSFNIVRVSFIIEKEKNHRIFPVKTKSNFNFAKRNLLSSPTVAYEFNNGFIFNFATSENNYIDNKLKYFERNGNVQNLNYNIFRGKELFIKERQELILFEEGIGSALNKIISIKENKNPVEITYPNNIKMLSPVFVNKNVYTGSTNSKLYKLNLLEINDRKLYYFDHLIKKGDLQITRDNSTIRIIHKYDNKIIFSYLDDIGKTQLAELDTDLIRIKFLTKNSDLEYSELIESIFYNKNNNKKLYFLANTSLGKRLFLYDYLEEVLITIEMNISLQRNLSDMKLYFGENKDFILMYNSFNKKVAALQLDFNILYDLPYEDIENISVSNDRTKTVFIKTDGTSLITSKNPNLEMTSFNGILVNNAYSVQNDHFVLRRRNSNEFYFLDSQNVLEKIDVDPSFNIINESPIITENSFFFQSLRNISGNQLVELFEYKYDLNYIVNKGISNFINGLPKQEGNQYIELISLPNSGEINNCLGLNGTANNNLNCNYIPLNNFVGIDSLSYDIKNSINNETIKQINVDFIVKNNKPFFNNKREVKEFANFSNFNLEVKDYSYINDELFFTSYDLNTESYSLYRYNQAEGLRLIKNSLFEFKHLTKSDSVLFFSENNIYFKYLPEQKIILDVYSELNNQLFSINDSLVIDNELFLITKASGNPPINSLIKINVLNNQFEKIVLPNSLEDGKFIQYNDSFYIESENRISFYDKTNKIFTRNATLSDPIQVGRGLQKDRFLIFILNSKISGIDVSSLVIYDPDAQVEISKTPLFALGFKTGDVAVPRLNENGSYSFLVETIALDNSVSTNELIRKDIQSRDERVLSFSGIYQFDTLIREFNEDLFFVSRSQNWSNAIFYTYSNIENYYVLNASSTPINLKEAEDLDLEFISYEITENPSFGEIQNCLGLNGSDVNELSCEYIHTDTSLNSVIDYFNYRAYDGFEYSEERIVKINIRNNAPEFEIYEQNLVVNKNIPENILFLPATDPENNTIYYIVEDLPSKGILTNCSFSENNLLLSNFCTYTPNNNEIGIDSYSYRAYDGLSFSDKVIVNIEINDNNSPIFSTLLQKEYVTKTAINYTIILEKAIDPQGENLNYTITRPTQFGTISNCFNLVENRLQCTYTPSNPNLRALDSFKYRASNGVFESEEREVLISITASNMTGVFGDLFLNDEFGLLLLKNGVDNTDSLRNLEGFDFNEVLKKVTLPANREYNFRSLNIGENYNLNFEPFDNVGNKTNNHGFTSVYVQGVCNIDGKIHSKGALTSGSSSSINTTSIDGELLNLNINNYLFGVFGGKGGGSSETARTSGTHGNPTLFKGGNGQPGIGDVGSEIEGGNRGQDGSGLYIKCLESIEGVGEISVAGENGENGRNGRSGSRNDITQVSFGGTGGSGGGNGGFGGALYLKSDLILFSGDLVVSGGLGGNGGFGGEGDATYTFPMQATNGTDGEDGFNGISGACFQSDLMDNNFDSCF